MPAAPAPAPAPTAAPAPADWLHHLQDEADAAFLYRELARHEPDSGRAELYRQLAGVEDRHVAAWRALLAEHGHPAFQPSPSGGARLRAWVGRRFGARLLLPLLLREEGREVKGYLDLYRESPDGAAAPTALQLARESKEHADRLATLTGAGAEPWHRRSAGGILRNVVYGFNDGLTANFGLVAGMIGAQATFGEAGHAVLVAGIAGMVADALSMGSSGYLAAKSEREVLEHEIAMERDEIRLLPELEREELRIIYQAKGLPEAQASALAERVMADPQRALEEKTREELGIAGEPGSPLREGWITGTATALGALIPVAPFLAGTGRWAIWSSFAISMLSHFAVGAARSIFTGRGVFRSGIDMFVVGLGVAAVGYVIGERMVRWLQG